MAAWTLTDAFVSLGAECLFRGQAQPDSTLYRVALSNGLTITRTTSLAAFEAAELSGNGYARQPYAPGAGSFDTVQKRHEFPEVIANFTATGASVQFDAIAVIANHGLAGETLAAFANISVQTIGDGATQPIAINFAVFNGGNVNGV